MTTLSWMMDGNASLVAMVLVGGVCVFGSILLRPSHREMAQVLTRGGLIFVFVLCTVSFLDLIRHFVVSDFSYRIVAAHSHGSAPLIHKIGAVWANHEGSLLLWLWVMALYGAAFAVVGGQILTSTVHLTLLTSVSIFLFFGCNPFEKLDFFVAEGAELNPLLQDGSLMIHPPLLYMGYVGFSLVFSRTVGALLSQEPLETWGVGVLPWVLMALCFLTMGTALGAFWAYYELGWGGYWFWDPVENVSLLPWLCGVALIHGLFLKRVGYGAVLMALSCFMFSVVGTFLVRSGLLSSVHSFAANGGQFMWVMIFLGLLVGLSALGLIHHRRGAQKTERGPMILLKIGVLCLQALLGTTVLGTMYPVAAGLLGGPIFSVGAPYFHRTFLPIAFLSLVFLTFSFYQKKRGYLFNGSTFWVFMGSALVIYAMEWVSPRFSFWDFSFVALGFFMVASYGLALKSHTKKGGGRLSHILKHGSHLGIILLTLGISLDHFWGQEQVIALSIGEKKTFHGYDFTLKDVGFHPHPTYVAERAVLTVQPSGRAVTPHPIYPEKRLYLSHNTLTTETALSRHGLSDWSVVFGGMIQGDRYTFRLIYHPFIQLIWMGAALIAFGFFLSALGRRHNTVKLKAAMIWVGFLTMTAGANATTHGEYLSDPILNQRAITLYTQLKCPTCRGVSVHESGTTAARAIRKTVRTLLIKGESDDGIKAALQKHYGDSIRFDPPLNQVTWPLWILPFIILGAGGIWIVRSFINKNQ